MPDAALSPLLAWESFYVIVGSSGAALTGLQFVVMALGADARVIRGASVGAFGTPTVVHFSAVLLFSAVLSAPWRGLFGPALILGACGVGGLLYTLIVIGRARQQTAYSPVREDWIWHTILPFVAYAALPVAALRLQEHAEQSLFVVAGVSILLLVIGIHNAWDSASYIAIQQAEKREP